MNLPLSFCLVRRCCVISTLGLAAALFGKAADAPVTPVEAVQKAVADWAKIREETIRLEGSWNSEKQLLSSTVKTLQNRAQSLETERKSLEAKTAGDRAAVDQLAKENLDKQTSLEAAALRLKKVGEKLLEVRATLPPRLSRALELPYRSLANPDLTPGERMKYVTSILNRCAQFNNTITYDEEPLTAPGEKDARLMETIYWGMSHAYALDRTGGKAYLGAPGEHGWTWEPAPDAAKPVAKLIDIYREKADPQFVEVPAHLRDVHSH